MDKYSGAFVNKKGGVYDSAWGAFQKGPTPKALYERDRRHNEAVGYNMLRNAVGGKCTDSYLKIQRTAEAKIRELKAEEARLLAVKRAETEKNRDKMLTLYHMMGRNEKKL